ncbi:MAG: hypothetical protein SGPRY_001563 [Prymnesium sp.]
MVAVPRWAVGLCLLAVCVLSLQRLSLSALTSRPIDPALLFARNDRNDDARLTLPEFAAALAEIGVPLPPSEGSPSLADPIQPSLPSRTPVPRSTEGGVVGKGNSSMPLNPPVSGRGNRLGGLPTCSLLFFYHIVKTGGTTMRTVLQRQAQLGHFEYIYTDSVKKPRWQLILHQLTHKVARRRMIVELHSEWGVGETFYADIKALRTLYEPLGCRVTLSTMLREPARGIPCCHSSLPCSPRHTLSSMRIRFSPSFHPHIAHQFSFFNWRASNHMPFCQWSPPQNVLSRQLCGFALPFVLPKDRSLYIPPATALAALEQYDVIGLMEQFDESLVLLADAAGFQHYPYIKLAANNKLKHPKLSKILLEVCTSKLCSSLAVHLGIRVATQSRSRVDEYLCMAMLLDSGVERLMQPLVKRRATWSEATLQAARAYNQITEESTRSIQKADCNFYPCGKQLSEAEGRYKPTMCSSDSPALWLDEMLNRTDTDRVVYSYALRKLEAQLQAMALRGVPMAARLEELRDGVTEVRKRRQAQLKEFTPDERKLWCKRSFTHPGYDAAEMAARAYPHVSPIPCWQTCWEEMQPNASAPHGKEPSCLLDGGTSLSDDKPSRRCEGRKVKCTWVVRSHVVAREKVKRAGQYAL